MTQHYIANVEGAHAIYVLERDGLTRRYLDGEAYETPREAIDAAKELDAERVDRRITPDDWSDLEDEPKPEPEAIPEPAPEPKAKRQRRLAKERREGRQTH